METIYAYMAGIVDGEGTLIITKAKRPENRSGCRFLPMLIITNTNKDVLDFFVEKTGYGKVTPRKESTKERFGWKTNKQAYRWSVKHSQVKEVIEKILPYLIIKKKQAENILEFFNSNASFSKNYNDEIVEVQFDFYIKSKELNGKILSQEEKNTLRPTIRKSIKTTSAI